MMWLHGEVDFPDPSLANEDGVLAVGDTLTPDMVEAAYRKGIFPWYEKFPVLWFSPPLRWVVRPEEFKIGRSLRKVLKKGVFEVRFNTSFERVIRECANQRKGETWITPELIEVFLELHRRGVAHCVETWQGGELVGGLYGVSMGRVFTGESMFYLVPDASKAALAGLAERMVERGFWLLDAQVHTEHLERFGAKPMVREDFLELLDGGLGEKSAVLDP